MSAATSTFFAGYVSLRFMGRSRAVLAMQQWPQTCSVEVSVVQGVRGLEDPLLRDLYALGFDRGALPHWGQALYKDGHGSRYPRYETRRAAYSRMSQEYTVRTFENALSAR